MDHLRFIYENLSITECVLATIYQMSAPISALLTLWCAEQEWKRMTVVGVGPVSPYAGILLYSAGSAILAVLLWLTFGHGNAYFALWYTSLMMMLVVMIAVLIAYLFWEAARTVVGYAQGT
ncbi:MAG: hypothetical protein KGI70_00810 [Patescibacteria group bacterium]|nr:hypothetical protein [Patescibacteria group bacterium]